MSQVSGSGSKLAAVAAAAAIVIWSTNAAAGGAALRGLTVIQVLALQFGGACVTLALARAIQTRREHRASAPVRGRPSRGSIAVAVLGLAGTMTLQYVAFALAPLVAANAIAYSWPLMVAAGVGVTHGSRRPIALAMVGFAGCPAAVRRARGWRAGRQRADRRIPRRRRLSGRDGRLHAGRRSCGQSPNRPRTARHHGRRRGGDPGRADSGRLLGGRRRDCAWPVHRDR